MNNPLKEYPYLFGNGKFKVQVGKQAKYITTFRPYINETSNSFYHNGFNMNECTLIARPISEMNHNEVYNCMDAYKDGQGNEYKEFGFTAPQIKGMIQESARIERLSSHQMLYLLSIGVYPFDQNDFADGVVINSTTL